ncbi:hypothetical protein ACRARG_18000 [Pseudooceanicola sp. C21-150M6]|uniref:aldose epimerase family protein n=1 Tax=Pseudooceanicola sp. C21-150M6 TaxID=3434355 RepID=UPI003D7FAD1F
MAELSAGPFHLSLDPDHGAAIRRLDLIRDNCSVPILATGDGGPDAGQSALFPMAPFANRARDNRLTVADREVQLAPNTPDPLCLHGWAWQRPWVVTQQTDASCRMALPLRDHGLRLDLTYDIALDCTGLAMTLSARNAGDTATLTGLGLHPYFPHRPDTQLQFSAGHVWREGPDHLPTRREPVQRAKSWVKPRPLPHVWHNQCYSDWTGHALIRQPSDGVDIHMAATGATALMLYTDPGLDRFALEPQSHVSGELHPGKDGLSLLAPGAHMAVTLRLTVAPIGTTPSIEETAHART